MDLRCADGHVPSVKIEDTFAQVPARSVDFSDFEDELSPSFLRVTVSY
jgi:hypothetical protein